MRSANARSCTARAVSSPLSNHDPVATTWCPSSDSVSACGLSPLSAKSAPAYSYPNNASAAIVLKISISLFLHHHPVCSYIAFRRRLALPFIFERINNKERKSQVYRRALSCNACNRDGAVMRGHDRLHNGQSQPHASGHSASGKIRPMKRSNTNGRSSGEIPIPWSTISKWACSADV